jgi:hypothetical protein
VIDQDVAHGLRRGAEELSSALPSLAGFPHKTHVRFVSQCCGLERMPGALPPHSDSAARNAPCWGRPHLSDRMGNRTLPNGAVAAATQIDAGRNIYVAGGCQPRENIPHEGAPKGSCADFMRFGSIGEIGIAPRQRASIRESGGE